MKNKLILTIFMALFLMSFAQAEVFGTLSCPELIICDTPEPVIEDAEFDLTARGIYILLGLIIGFLIKAYGTSLFSKKKEKTILDNDDDKPTDVMFEEASKAVEETGTDFKWDAKNEK